MRFAIFGSPGQTSVPFQTHEEKDPGTKKRQIDTTQIGIGLADSNVRYLTIRENIFAIAKTLVSLEKHSPAAFRNIS